MTLPHFNPCTYLFQALEKCYCLNHNFWMVSEQSMAAASTKSLFRVDPFTLFGQRLKTCCVMSCCAGSLLPSGNSTPVHVCSFSNAPADIRQWYAVFSHSLKQPEIRILDICECTLIITQQFLFTWRPLALFPRQGSQPLQGMVTLAHINLTELLCLLLFPGGNR